MQEATSKPWSDLDLVDRGRLWQSDPDFLLWQVEAFRLDAVFCNGRTPWDKVLAITGGSVKDTGTIKRTDWYTGTANVAGKELGIAGWNIPLIRATGLDAAEEKQLGRILGGRLSGYGILP